MQDISNLGEIDLDQYLNQLKTKPIDEKLMKNKCDRLFAITESNQHEYLGDVKDVYAWLLLINRKISFKELIPSQRAQKYFCGEFLNTSVKNLILCRKFRLSQMMLLTEQIFVECIIFFNNHFDDLDRLPGLGSLLFSILRIDRLFYKQNAITNFPHLIVQPTEQDIIANNTFIDQLKQGDIVDALKTQMHGNRLCWSRAIIKKITSISIYISFLNDNLTSSRNVDRTSFQVVPLNTYTKNDYDWRLNTKIGDKVDYETSDGWITTEIEEIKVLPSDNQHKVIHELKLKCEDNNQVFDVWVSSTSTKVQRPYLILNKDFGFDSTINHDKSIDDFNDIILDQDRKGKDMIIRSDIMKSLLFTDLANLMNDTGVFKKILKATQQKTFGVEVCAEFAGFISLIQSIFNRNFSIRYLKDYSTAILNYIKDLDDNKIRNLSKERLTNLLAALKDFYSKLLPSDQKRSILQGLELDLALRFINSDFLQRKMQAVSIFTDLLKHSILRPSEAYMKSSQLFQWFSKNDIIKKIFNEKSHSELVGRGADFLQSYLIQQQNPDLNALSALLDYSEPLLKLNNQFYEYLPAKLKQQLVDRISQRQNVTNKDALQIMKKYGGNQSWFLKNGGEMWVDVVRMKKNKADDINQVFKQPFQVVLKITEQISKSYDGRLKSQYFEALLNSDYLHEIFILEIQLTDKIRLLKVILDYSFYFSAQLFQQFLKLWQTNSKCQVQEFYLMFQNIISKLKQSEIQTFFTRFFQEQQQLKQLNRGSFKIFSKLFIKINQLLGSITKRYTESYSDGYPSKRQKKEILTITVNPIKLHGMNNLMLIVFESKLSEVVESALNFISFLFNHLTPVLAESIGQFKDNFLQQCLQKLYKSQNPSKYLQIIKSILDESQKDGNGNLPNIECTLPGQKMKFTIIDSFSVVKKRFTIEVMSNITVFEFRFLLGKEIGAFIHEISLSIDKKPIIEMLNGYTLRQANLGQPILIQRKCQIEKAQLVGNNNKLTEQAKLVFSKIFGQYSTNGLMSKQDCLRFNQKCVGGESSSMSGSSQSKVDKLFTDYDADKDGNLQFKQFLQFYENAARQKAHIVWNNLENFGVRPDLKILDDLTITHVEPTTLIRHLLVNDQKFMTLLFKTLELNDQQSKINAWTLLSRLPLDTKTQFNFNLKNPYHLKYWLYLIDGKKEYSKITKQISQIIIGSSDAETLAIGLKSAIQVQGLDLSIFQTLINKLNEISKKPNLTVFQQLSLDYSLSLIVKCLINLPSVQQQFVNNREKYESVLLNGLLSINSDIRERYSLAIWTILQECCESNFNIFQIMFTLLYRHFETSTKSSLHPEFFELFSKTLELIRDKTQILQSLKLNWKTLTKSVIERFKTHKCTEERISSPPDWVVQGFMHILSRLLDQNTACDLEQLIPYLFQTLLFPEGGTNKLKTATSRKQAYELIYIICKYNPSSLESLFKSGFRKIYKSLSSTKPQTYSYFSSFYNDVRADCGYAGVRNLGCICYMIAMIQQFYLTRPLRYLLLMADDQQPECLVKKGSKQIDDNILHQFQQMFANLQLTQRQQYDPNEFCFSFKDFQGNPVNVSIQQDAQQFLNMLFDKLQKGLSQTPFKQVLHSIYGGTSCNQLICSNCKNVKERQEHYFNISLDIKGFKNYDESFKKFIQGQVISDYMCDSCKQKTDTIKRTLLSELPNYLIVHLQRICFNYDKFQNQKINSRWEFPDELNVYDYTIDKERNKPKSEHYQYKLKGIVVHIGSAEYGHYFSYIKVSENQWLEFNDQKVREFDPDDIENECYGGEHWRRQNQSAYLLVYEKKIKKQIKLQFNSQEQMQQMSKIFELPLELIKKQQTPQQQSIEVQVQAQEKNQNEQGQTKQPKKEAIIGVLDIQKVPYYVPDKLIAKINKSNQEFSMSINVSNNQFAHFIYRILSIEPPTSLRSEFLQLCHECFHFKQQLNDDNSLSDWMVTRFKELIVGSGWEFYDQAAKTWERDILSNDKSTRSAAKNVLVAVLTDIITPQLISKAEQQVDTNEKQQQSTDLLDKEQPEVANHVKIIKLLDKILQMMEDQVPKSYYRLEQYFEFWYELFSSNKILMKYAESRSMMEYLLDFVMQDNSPFKSKHRNSKSFLRFNHLSLQSPMQLIGLFIKQGYKLSPEELSCFGHISYLQQLIKSHPLHFNLIEFSCKSNILNTERLTFLILYTTSKISHSDDVKPIMVVTERFLAIDDHLRQYRIEWLLGYPQLIYNQKTDNFGMICTNNIMENPIMRYRSGLRHDSLLQILENNRPRHEHISARLVTMLMDLQNIGYFNLSQIESPLVFNKDYSSWIPTFSKKYYEESRRMKGLNYMSYGDKIIDLVANRQPIERTQPSFLIGATLEKKQIYIKNQQNIQIVLESYTVPLIPSKATFQFNQSIPTQLFSTKSSTAGGAKTIKKYPGAEKFFPVSSASSFMRSSTYDDDDSQKEQSQYQRFANPIISDYILKLTFKNISSFTQIVVVKFLQNTNVQLPSAPISYEIEPKRQQFFVAHKIFPDQQLNDLKYQVSVYQKKASDRFGKNVLTQFVTPIVQDDGTAIDINSDQENNFSC